MGNTSSKNKDNYEDPWRDIYPKNLSGNFKELKEHYHEKITAFKPHNDVQFINALLLGQTASGKSSFINSCATALRQENRVSTPAGVITPQVGSCTGRLVQPLLKMKGGETLPVRLFDCRGLHQRSGVHSKDLDDIIAGHVKPGYMIDPDNRITNQSEYYRKNPEMGDKMHVIVHVAAADCPGEHFTDDQVKQQLQELKTTWIRKSDLPHMILLTKVDRLGLRDTKDIFLSKTVKRVCENAETGLTLPLNHVFPTINYADKIHSDDFLDFLALYNLLQIVNKGNDYVENNSAGEVPEGFRA